MHLHGGHPAPSRVWGALLKLSHMAGRRAAPCFFRTLLNPGTAGAAKPRGTALCWQRCSLRIRERCWHGLRAPSLTKPVPCRFTSNWGGLCYTMTCKLPSRFSPGLGHATRASPPLSGEQGHTRSLPQAKHCGKFLFSTSLVATYWSTSKIIKFGNAHGMLVPQVVVSWVPALSFSLFPPSPFKRN